MTTEYITTDYPYVLGRGKILVRKDTETVWQDLFHASEFKLNITTEEKTHDNFRTNLKVVDRNAILSAKAVFSFKIDVPLVDNVRKFLLADDVSPTVVTQTGAAWTAAEMTVVEQGKWQEIIPDASPTDPRRNWCVVTLVTTGAGPTTLTENTDYVLDRSRGLINVLPAATLTDSKINITGSYPTITSAHGISQVKAGSAASMSRHIWYQGDPSTGIIQDIQGWGLMKPNGEMDFIGDEWQGFQFDGTFMAHATYGVLGLRYEQRGSVGDVWPVFV